MDQEIINILWENGKIPHEITLNFILPYSHLLPCGCPDININNKCPYYKISKNKSKLRTKTNKKIAGYYQLCQRCKEDQIYDQTHFCVFCKCNYNNCNNSCLANLKFCQEHMKLSRNKNLYRRARKCIDLDICSYYECMGIAKELELIALQDALKNHKFIEQLNGYMIINRPVYNYEQVLNELKLKRFK